MVDLNALVAKAKARVVEAETVTQPVILEGEKVGVRVTSLDPSEWRLYTLQHPPREGVRLDTNAGFDVDAAAREFKGVQLVSGDETVDLGDEWPAIYEKLARQDKQNLAYAVWMIHDSAYIEAVKTAGKALPGARKKKRS